jgi:PAS domain S-box-containing protein
MTEEREKTLRAEITSLKKRITSLEKAELAQAYLASLVESADDAIVSKTLESIVTSWNPAAQRMFGYTAEEMIGQSITVLIPAQLRTEEDSIIHRIREGKRIDHFETQRIAKSGVLIDVSLTISPIRNEDGSIIGASHVARDITERRTGEDQLRRALEDAKEARKQAEVASRLKDEFLAAVSHELRTPLTAVIGWIRMMRAGNLDATQTEKALEVIDRNIRSQAQLIEDLLDISRITMGKLRLDVRPVQPATVINAAVESLRFAADARAIRIQTVLDSNAGPISADFERLQQVVWNLLSNAIKFTPKGGRVQIVLERVNSHIEIRVSDTGRGITPEFLPRIFERFSQADAVTTRVHGGLGMGLAISKVIVELHGGVINVASEGEGKGAVFSVSLPLMAVRQSISSDRVHPKTGWSDIPLACPPEIAGLKVLVVDDDADTCDMIRTVLEECGVDVRTSLSAEGALDAFARWRPEVIISDIGMPEVDGFEFIGRVRQREHELGTRTPAIALTAFARIEDRVKALAAGYQMHVAKPVDPGELLTIVASVSGFLTRKP